jgi:sugar/nucleoside kinase (ribokinase family)
LEVLEQVSHPQLTALDTMNFWITGQRENLAKVIERVDAVLINEAEIREFTGRYNVLDAARALQDRGPRYVVVKRGEYGSLLFAEDEVFLAPAYPTFEVRDTTGAGDSFAGGFMGYLDQRSSTSLVDLKAAVVYGTVMASFTVEDFSVTGLLRATPAMLHERYARLAEMTRIDAPLTLKRPHLVTEGV